MIFLSILQTFLTITYELHISFPLCYMAAGEPLSFYELLCIRTSQMKYFIYSNEMRRNFFSIMISFLV